MKREQYELRRLNSQLKEEIEGYITDSEKKYKNGDESKALYKIKKKGFNLLKKSLIKGIEECGGEVKINTQNTRS